MNKKYAIASIVLIALMSLSLIPMQAKAYETGPGSPNTNYANYGPRPSTLLMKVYSGFASEFSDFQAGAIDFEDEILTPAQYAAIQGNPTFTTGFVPQYSLREYDLNDYVNPFNSTYYRQGLTFLIDRNYFINTYSSLAGAATPAYSPIACDAPYYPAAAMAALYPPSNASAYVAFMNSGFSLIPDPTDPTHYCTWAFASPYTTVGPNGEPIVPDNQIEVFARTEQAERTLQGDYLVQVAQLGLPAWALANLGNSVFSTYPLPTDPSSPYPGHVLLPRIVVNDYHYPRATCSQYVMSDYDYMIYTGGWSLSSTPDFLQFYTYQYAPVNLAFAPGVHNYGACELQPPYAPNGITYSNDVNSLLASSPAGSGGLPVGSGSYWAYICQYLLMGDAALIPMWYYSGYSAMASSMYNGINSYGVGFNNWWSFFDAYRSGGSGSSDTIKYGWSADVQNMNPITSTWYWDWQILGEIYDSMISGNPYNPSQINPGLADNYSVTVNVPSINSGNTVVTVHIRPDVFFQDIPFKDRTAYTVDGGAEINGPFINKSLSVLDEAFNIVYLRDMDYWYGTDNGILIDDVDHVVISSIYNNTSPVNGWPFWNATAYPLGAPWFNSTDIAAECVGESLPPITWQYNYVQFSSALDANTIQLFLTDKVTWLAYFRDLAIPILPHYIFEWLATDSWQNSAWPVASTMPMVETMDLTPWAGANLLYGTGPYVLTAGTPGNSYTMQAYATNLAYGGLTEKNSYFWQPVRLADTMTLGADPETDYYKPDDTSIIHSVTIQNTGSNPMTVSVTVSCTLTWYPGYTTQVLTPQTHSGIYLLAGQYDTEVFTFSFVKQGAFCVASWDPIIKVTAASASDGDFVGRSTQSLLYADANRWPYYTNGIEVINAGKLGADIAGGPVVAPYYGADGSVGAKDLNLLGVQWGKSSVGASPTSNVARADINGDGTVGAKDLNKLGVEWGQTWSISLQPTVPLKPYGP